MPKEIYTILAETLSCSFPGEAKDLKAPLYYLQSNAENMKNMSGNRESIISYHFRRTQGMISMIMCSLRGPFNGLERNIKV